MVEVLQGCAAPSGVQGMGVGVVVSEMLVALRHLVVYTRPEEIHATAAEGDVV